MVQELSAALAAALQVAGDEWKADASFKLAEQADLIAELQWELKSVRHIAAAAGEEVARMVDAIDAERADYRRSLARREQEITDVRNLLDEMTDRHWKFVNNCPPNESPTVAAMVSGAILEAAEVYRDTGNKISAIKQFRVRTGLGLRESVLIVRDQIAAIVDWKEATD
jgi:hypothetical protein